MLPSRSEIDHLHARLCSGISDPTRIIILYALSESPLNVSQLVDSLALPQSTISRHLGILRDSGLVSAERDGRQVTYSLSDERVITALNLMREILSERINKHADLLSLSASE